MSRLATLFLLILLAPPAQAQVQTRAVYVVSQGAFGQNNANVVRVDPAAGTATTPLAGRPYTQGAQIVGDRLYLTAGSDGSSRVDVISLATDQQVGQITGTLTTLRNPRYLAALPGGRALVTNQTYAFAGTDRPFVSIVELASNAVTATVELDRNPEGVTLAGGFAYVALGGSDGSPRLALLDLATNTLARYLDLGCRARFVFTDAQDEVWAVCRDEVVVLAGATGEVVARIAAPTPISLGFAQEATYDAASQTLFAVAVVPDSEPRVTRVLRFSTATNTYGGAVTVPGAEAVSAIGYDPQNARLYLGRPSVTSPFSAAGAVSVVDLDGAQTASYPAGVYPTFVAVYTTGAPTSAEDDVPLALALGAPRPNPTAGRAALDFTLREAGPARLAVYDALGREVAVLAEGAFAAGTHAAALEAGALPAGLYLVRLEAGGRAATQRLTVVR